MAEARNVTFQLDEADFALLERETRLFGGKLSAHQVARVIVLRHLNDASRAELLEKVSSELERIRSVVLRTDENVGEILGAAADILDRLPGRVS